MRTLARPVVEQEAGAGDGVRAAEEGELHRAGVCHAPHRRRGVANAPRPRYGVKAERASRSGGRPRASRPVASSTPPTRSATPRGAMHAADVEASSASGRRRGAAGVRRSKRGQVGRPLDGVRAAVVGEPAGLVGVREEEVLHARPRRSRSTEVAMFPAGPPLTTTPPAGPGRARPPRPRRSPSCCGSSSRSTVPTNTISAFSAASSTGGGIMQSASTADGVQHEREGRHGGEHAETRTRSAFIGRMTPRPADRFPRRAGSGLDAHHRVERDRGEEHRQVGDRVAVQADRLRG